MLRKITGAHLDYAEAARSCRSEYRAEIEVVRKYDVTVLVGVAQDLAVRRGRFPDRGPMNRIPPILPQNVAPIW